MLKAGFYLFLLLLFSQDGKAALAEEVSRAVVAAVQTQPSQVVNQFTPGVIRVKLEEPSYHEGQLLLPGKTIRKDPLVKNIGNRECYAFLTVDIPMRVIRLAGDPFGAAGQERELVTFTPDEKWSFILNEIITDPEEDSRYNRYVYGYSDILRPAEETVPLFTYMTAAEYLEGDLEDGAGINIPIRAMAVQKEGLGTLEEAWQVCRITGSGQ